MVPMVDSAPTANQTERTQTVTLTPSDIAQIVNALSDHWVSLERSRIGSIKHGWGTEDAMARQQRRVEAALARFGMGSERFYAGLREIAESPSVWGKVGRAAALGLQGREWSAEDILRREA